MWKEREEKDKVLFPLSSILQGQDRGGGVSRSIEGGGGRGGGGVLAGLLVAVAGLGDAGVGGGWRARLHRRFL